MSQVQPYQPLNQNPVSIPSAAAIQLGRENGSRLELEIQNVGTAIIYIGLGFPPTNTNYTFAVNPCSALHDSLGGTRIDDEWKGATYAIAAASGVGLVQYTEKF
jgi:hypothetical protein